MWKGRVVSVVVFIGCVWMTGGLKCLQCLDYMAGGPCVHDTKTLVAASQGVFENGSRYYYKECPGGSFGPLQNFCVIEEFIVGGARKSFIRDCSDGKNFSFTGTVKNAKLENVAPDNFTTCIYLISANAHVCLSLCQGDFCNGPLPPNETACVETGNATCGAARLFPFASGPFGPIVDRVLGRGGYFLPLLTAMLCVTAFG
ncbi:uncharacterized protein LOC143287412 [Babylonia areolata]|uniref:uncharacterized protein LOC143287412 n=1 Tax=Babylonia areolata TaxID=304850 RepID=UPI003FD251B5